jgi:glycogen debranching enzyme
VGFIAQEVEEVFPRWVDEHPDGFKIVAVPPMQLAALEIEALRALKAENDELKKEARAVKARTSAVEERLDRQDLQLRR